MKDNERKELILLLKKMLSYLEAEDGGQEALHDNTVDLEKLVTNYICKLGIPAHFKGYHYIRSSIIISIEDSEMLSSLSQKLYPYIAKMYNTTPSRVERAIRNAIETMWFKGNVEVQNEIFGYSRNDEKKKPQNGKFLARFVDHVKLNCM